LRRQTVTVATRSGEQVTSLVIVATALYLTLCVDANYSAVKANNKKWRFQIPVYWRVDIYKLIDSLVKHNVVGEEAYTDEFFYIVRNGYIQLRRMRIPSLERLVTSIFKSLVVLREFCTDFPREAGNYLLKEVLNSSNSAER
jgi:hypothetical protein